MKRIRKRIRRALGLILALMMLASISCQIAFAGNFPVVDEPEEYMEPVGDGWQKLAELYSTNSEQWLPVAPGWFAALRKSYSGYEDHYAANSILEQSLGRNYIVNQATCPNFYIGFCRMADVGCEIAAIYNALNLAEYYHSCASIIRAFEKDGYLMGVTSAGDLGSDPYAIGLYLTYNFISHTQFSNYDEMKSAVDGGRGTRKVYIVSYWNGDDISGGLHTIALSTSSYNSYILAYNKGGTIETQTDFASIITASNRYIVGYCINL